MCWDGYAVFYNKTGATRWYFDSIDNVNYNICEVASRGVMVSELDE